MRRVAACARARPAAVCSHYPLLALHRAACSDANLKDWDPVVYDLLIKEKQRQVNGIELIASENFT